MSSRIAPFSDFYPQVGDALDTIAKKLLYRTLEPATLVNCLTSAARLGTTSVGPVIGYGFRGIVVTAKVNGVVGVGSLQILVKSGATILAMSTIASTSTATFTQSLFVYPGMVNGAFSSVTGGNCAIGNAIQIDFTNVSAVGGNEVTFEAYYTLLA